MSDNNVDVVRRALEAFNRGDLDLMASDAAPDFEYVTSGIVPGAKGVYRGAEAFVHGFLKPFWAEFDDPHIEVHQLIEGENRVLADQTFRGRGKQSGIDVSWDIFQLWTLRDGKLVRGEGFPDRDEALAAVAKADSGTGV